MAIVEGCRMPEGRIIKALSGYYYVQDRETQQVWQCRARGVFKKRKINPLVGDEVEYEPGQNEEGTVTVVRPRKNELLRPPVANVDQALLVFSIREPDFSALLLDKFLVHIERANIQAMICISKTDLAPSPLELFPQVAAYERIGYPVFYVSNQNDTGFAEVEEALKHKVTVFAGQSGVGKSSLLNALNPDAELETSEISDRLGRGKHTTRHVELIPLPKGGYVADTPGFSQLDFDPFEPEELSRYFVEFAEPAADCKFRACLHQNEPQCAVKAAVEAGEIDRHRYEHYLQFLSLIQDAKQKRGY
jgi:ribosome biogenesis GTPase